MTALENQTAAPPESLTGLIERVTFFNEDNGFAVIKVKARGHREPITVVGSLPSVNAGEWLTAEGRWVQDREFGLQFRAELLRSAAPTTREGIEKYLASGMVKGIGPAYAGKLVAKFGEKIFDIIENCSGRLEEVEGIGPERRRRIKAAWAEQKIIREIMVFLHSNGVSASRAVRIYKTYGEQAIETLRANPYVLAKDIRGIGFRTADQIAQKMGVPHESLLRACAGLAHVLSEATSQGHCALPAHLLQEEACKLLDVPESFVESALERTLEPPRIDSRTGGRQDLVFLPLLKRAEQGIAERVKRLCASPASYPAIDFEKAVAWCEQRTGPGSGRQSTRRFAAGLDPADARHYRRTWRGQDYAAQGDPDDSCGQESALPALRADRSRGQTPGRNHGPGSQDHPPSVGGRSPAREGFLRNETRPLDCDLLVVDETSMVDVALMHPSAARPCPRKAALLLVGDVDQLPSVGPGIGATRSDGERDRAGGSAAGSVPAGGP